MHHGVMSSALNRHLFNHRVSLTVHEAAVKRIATLKNQLKTTTSENQSLLNMLKDLKKMVLQWDIRCPTGSAMAVVIEATGGQE